VVACGAWRMVVLSLTGNEQGPQMQTKDDHSLNPFCRAAAYHEAGHAIAAVLIGNFDISAKLDHRDICIGNVSSLGPANPDPSTEVGRMQLVQLIFQAFAGHAAEIIFWRDEVDQPVGISNWQGDLNSAYEAASSLAGPTLPIDDILSKMMAYTTDTLKLPHMDAALRRISTQLLSVMFLRDDEIRSLCGQLPRPIFPII